MAQHFLTITNLSKAYGSTLIFQDVNLTLSKGQTISVLGRSGCGKTTMLKAIAGLVSPDHGAIYIDGQDVTSVPPHLRQIVYLYQEDLLFPHLNVYDNIAFGLKLQKIAPDEIRNQVDTMLYQLELQEQAHKRPSQISGGQRQRVSFGRAIIIRPQLLLLDEPFGSLDVETRHNMQVLFKRLTKAYDMTAMFVTHDLKEALLMGDRLAYMANGNLNVYNDKGSFVNDPVTGISQELDFWNDINNLKHG